MSLADTTAAVMFAAIIAYAVLGGADFGSGIWDLVAGRDRAGGAVRRLVDHAIGPVWEANHVWLIFVLVFLWTAFPVSFVALIQTLAIPFWIVAFGIVTRGAAFAFRKVAPSFRWARAAGVAFASSSLVTPFFLGVIAGAVASGRVRLDEPTGSWSAWITVTSLVGGVLASLTCAFLAGVFLAAEAAGLGQDELAHEIRDKTVVLGAITGAFALFAIWPLSRDAPTLFDGLIGRGLGVIAVSAIAGSGTLVLLYTGKFRAARVGATLAVGGIVLGWGVAQYPWLLVDEISITDAAGSRPALIGLLGAAAIAAVLVVPALVYLFWLADSDAIGQE